jgi:predicted HTH domain antitoxin
MESSQPTDLISVTEARRLIGVSRIKMAELIKKNIIQHYPYPVDRRVKLVSKGEVIALKNTRR